jgi:hypothetical protein
MMTAVTRFVGKRFVGEWGGVMLVEITNNMTRHVTRGDGFGFEGRCCLFLFRTQNGPGYFLDVLSCTTASAHVAI